MGKVKPMLSKQYKAFLISFYNKGNGIECKNVCFVPFKISKIICLFHFSSSSFLF